MDRFEHRYGANSLNHPKISFCPQCLYYWFDYSASTSHTPTSRVNDFIYTIEFVTNELKKMIYIRPIRLHLIRMLIQSLHLDTPC